MLNLLSSQKVPPLAAKKFTDQLATRVTLPQLVLGLSLLAAFVARLLHGSFIIDDAYISFRYAQNLVDGHGLIYNLGEPPVLGTTTPLFTLWLSLFYKLGLSFEGVSLWTSILSDCATISLVYLIGRQASLPSLGLLAGWLVALWPDYLTYAVSGMETSLYVALLLGAYYLYCRDFYGWAGLVMALLVLVRPDGLLMVAVLFGHYLLVRRKIPWKMGLLFSPLPLVWVIFATLYYGSPLSHSIVAKAAISAESPTESFIQLLIFLNTSIKPALTVLAVLGLYAVLRYQPYSALRLLLAWWLLYIAVFISRGAFHYFPWYYTPLLPMYFMLAGSGLFSLITRFRGALPANLNNSRLKRAGTLALAVAGIGVLVWLNIGNWKTLQEEYVNRSGLYKAVAERYLNSRTRLAANEIGALGYFCQRCPVIDLSGLITPEAVNLTQLDTLKTTRPDFIIAYDNHLTDESRGSAWLSQTYTLLETHPVKLYGQGVLYVLKRRDL